MVDVNGTPSNPWSKRTILVGLVAVVVIAAGIGAAVATLAQSDNEPTPTTAPVVVSTTDAAQGCVDEFRAVVVTVGESLDDDTQMELARTYGTQSAEFRFAQQLAGAYYRESVLDGRDVALSKLEERLREGCPSLTFPVPEDTTTAPRATVPETTLPPFNPSEVMPFATADEAAQAVFNAWSEGDTAEVARVSSQRVADGLGRFEAGAQLLPCVEQEPDPPPDIASPANPTVSALCEITGLYIATYLPVGPSVNGTPRVLDVYESDGDE